MSAHDPLISGITLWCQIDLWRMDIRLKMTLKTVMFTLAVVMTTLHAITSGQSPEIWFQPMGYTAFVHQTWTVTMTVSLDDYPTYFSQPVYRVQQFRLHVNHQLENSYNSTQLQTYQNSILPLVQHGVDQLTLRKCTLNSNRHSPLRRKALSDNDACLSWPNYSDAYLVNGSWIKPSWQLLKP